MFKQYLNGKKLCVFSVILHWCLLASTSDVLAATIRLWFPICSKWWRVHMFYPVLLWFPVSAGLQPIVMHLTCVTFSPWYLDEVFTAESCRIFMWEKLCSIVYIGRFFIEYHSVLTLAWISWNEDGTHVISPHSSYSRMNPCFLLCRIWCLVFLFMSIWRIGKVCFCWYWW